MHPPHQRDAILSSILANGYNPRVEAFRSSEYPCLTGTPKPMLIVSTFANTHQECTYLDHGGTTLYPKSAIEAFSADLCSNLFGNPHSLSPSSQLSSLRVDNVRLRILQYFNADPELFDVVFCANATAAMKLVADGFSAQKPGFKYAYHGDAHTSLVGIRELSVEDQCFYTDEDVEQWLATPSDDQSIGLFSWPGQSNFTGRRLPLRWSGDLRASHPNYYSMLDAAALLTTGILDLSDASTAPDFTVLSFYKIFGFPDMGALILRRDASGILAKRKYFGGGTVDALTTRTGFVAHKKDIPHSYLEDGTIPFHSIIALDAMMDAQTRLYGTQKEISMHAFSLGNLVHRILSDMTHSNGRKVCLLYGGGDYDSPLLQGPTVTFNMKRPNGMWVGYAEVEKLSAVKNIHIRAGSMCNPGGMNTYVGLEPWEIEKNYAAGHRCSDSHDIIDGKPTGAVRVSLGAMSTVDDVLAFVKFIDEFYVDQEDVRADLEGFNGVGSDSEARVESLMIYPIKSCGAFKIPVGVPWEIKPHGLAWDREWCLVHLGTGSALSQKAYNRMTILRPEINLDTKTLVVNVHGSPSTPPLRIPLNSSPAGLAKLRACASRVCGDKIMALTYDSPEIVDFFTKAVGVPCTLARFPADSTTSRNYKPHLKDAKASSVKGPKILLSNESPILIVNQSSVDRLNNDIAKTGGKLAKADVFRANIVLKDARPYAEDEWSNIMIGGEQFEVCLSLAIAYGADSFFSY